MLPIASALGGNPHRHSGRIAAGWLAVNGTRPPIRRPRRVTDSIIVGASANIDPRGRRPTGGRMAQDDEAREFAWRVHEAQESWIGKIDVKASVVLAFEGALALLALTSDPLRDLLQGP